MRSIKFPNMFNTNSTNVWREGEYNEATTQNTILVLHCERGELFSDPYFGVLIQHYMFDQNNYVLRDAIADIIYNQLAIFIPQIHVERKDIKIIQNKQKGKLICTFHGINQIDYKTNIYNLVLFENTEAIQ